MESMTLLLNIFIELNILGDNKGAREIGFVANTLPTLGTSASANCRTFIAKQFLYTGTMYHLQYAWRVCC